MVFRPRMLLPMLLLSLISLLAGVGGGSSAANAQGVTTNWQQLGGPAGLVTRLAAMPDGRELYAVSAVAVSRRDDQTQWFDSGAVRTASALYRSVDAGATWSPVTNDLPPGVLGALYVDARTKAVYVGLQGAGDEMTSRSGLWRSTDRGRSWLQVPVGRDNLIVIRIARSGTELLFAAIDSGKYPSSYIYRSTDNGAAWSSVEVLHYGDDAGSVLADFAVHPVAGERQFVTTLGGDLLVTTDAGTTWQTGSAARAEVAEAPALAIEPERGDTALLARSTEGNLGIERSTDGGVTWRARVSGLPARASPRTLEAFAGGVMLLNTSAGSYRSIDSGVNWQPLEGALSAGGVSEFLAVPGESGNAMAATGFGVFASTDGGALWQSSSGGLPVNGKILGLLTHSAAPAQVFAIPDARWSAGNAAPPLFLLSLDGGQRWAPAAQGLPETQLTAWTMDPANPAVVYLAGYEAVFRSTDTGASWQTAAVPFGSHRSLAVATSDPSRLYLAGQPGLTSTDRGITWRETPVRKSDDAEAADIFGLAVDPVDAQHVWAAGAGGAFESRDAGATWQPYGLAALPVRWLYLAGTWDGSGKTVGPYTLYAGVTDGGLYRRELQNGGWEGIEGGPASDGSFLAFAHDPRGTGVAWATRDGGGVYRSTDRGSTWTNAADGLGDALGQALAIDYADTDALFLGAAAGGVWSLNVSVPTAPAARASRGSAVAPGNGMLGVDARIEVVWPHDWSSVEQAKLANVGIRLFVPDSLRPPACGWRPNVALWRAVSTDPAEPVSDAEQRAVDGQPFPYWEANDVDVSPANDPAQKLYFFVRVDGVPTASSIWAHGADPRTYFPDQDVPSGVATESIEAVDARIQVVWPHDTDGRARGVAEAQLANVAVAFFKHGTRLSVPPGWEHPGIMLHGSWNQEVGRPLARPARVQLRQSGAIIYPVWEFDNVPVARAADGASKLYMWVAVEGLTTYPTIWAHGADSRTFFPAQDEPIEGCRP